MTTLGLDSVSVEHGVEMQNNSFNSFPLLGMEREIRIVKAQHVHLQIWFVETSYKSLTNINFVKCPYFDGSVDTTGGQHFLALFYYIQLFSSPNLFAGAIQNCHLSELQYFFSQIW